MEFFLCVIGMVMVIEGLPYFGFPEKMKDFMRVVQSQDDNTLRIFGGLMMGLGVIMIFFARRGLGVD